MCERKKGINFFMFAFLSSLTSSSNDYQVIYNICICVSVFMIQVQFWQDGNIRILCKAHVNFQAKYFLLSRGAFCALRNIRLFPKKEK